MTVNPATLNLKSIVDVEVYISPQAAPRATFNHGLIIGGSTHIPTTTRILKVGSLADMVSAGFNASDPEYIAASLYFSQNPAPQYLYIGRQDLASESFLDAINACRNANYDWYVFMIANAAPNAPAKADHINIAGWAKTAIPSTVYFFTTQDADVPTGTAGNVFLSLQALSYSRVWGQYATDQNGSYPNNIYACAAAMGYAMGANTGLANSAYTLKFKEEVGVTTEPLTLTAVQNIESANGNVYLSYGNYYNILEQGVMADGQFFDEIINLDMLVNGIQLNVMDLLYGVPKVPLTDPGVTQIIHQVNLACDDAVSRGFLAPGEWTGPQVLNLNNGDMLPKGYLTQSPPVSTMSDADRSARKSPPLYCAIKESGAVHSVLIGVYVNR